MPEGLSNGLRFLKDFEVREAQYLASSNRQGSRAAVVTDALNRSGVLTAVELCRQAKFMAVEVDDKGLDAVLRSSRHRGWGCEQCLHFSQCVR